MAKNKKNWHPNFYKYMEEIVNHDNYLGLAIEKKKDGNYAWIKSKKSDVGKKRLEWCESKACELGYEIEPSVYSKVMRTIHPTGMKVCQTCGESLSVFYYYPTKNTLKKIKKVFGYDYKETQHIQDIWEDLKQNKISQKKIKKFFIDLGKLKINADDYNKSKIIELLEANCRENGCKVLSPGAMSNFPDRFDGFHTYNRCCRASEDKGRSSENMKTYGKDRRAYEYWSDGDIQAANQFMGSKFFAGKSADHIGPISLGFIHDSHYIQVMNSNENSSKRDRIKKSDIKKIIEIEKSTKVLPVNWYSKLIWEHIKKDYLKGSIKLDKYRSVLKQNMANYMYSLNVIFEECGEKGIEFLEEAYLKSKYMYFDYSYGFDSSGNITKQSPRRKTDSSRNEKARFKRIAIESIKEYNIKGNRNLKISLSEQDEVCIKKICKDINAGYEVSDVKEDMEKLMVQVQIRMIKEFCD